MEELVQFIKKCPVERWIRLLISKTKRNRGIECEYKKPIHIDVPYYRCWLAKVLALLTGFFSRNTSISIETLF